MRFSAVVSLPKTISIGGNATGESFPITPM